MRKKIGSIKEIHQIKLGVIYLYMDEIDEKTITHLRREIGEQILKQYPTVEQFCWAHDLSKATLSNFLRGKKDIKLTTLIRIVNALGKRLDVKLKSSTNSTK